MEQKQFQIGWLSPEGMIRECAWNEHNILAIKILAEKGVESRQPEQTLMGWGWVNIGCGINPYEYDWRMNWIYELMPRQISFLEPYFAEDSGIKINSMTRRKWDEDHQLSR